MGHFQTDWTEGYKESFEKAVGLCENHGSALEIGCFEGRSTIFFAEKFDHVDVIDTFKGSPEIINSGYNCEELYETFHKNTLKLSNKITPHVGMSHNVMCGMVSQGRMFDFVYVDGSHTAIDCATDTLLSIGMLNKGGVILIDDYLNWMELTPGSRTHDAVDFIIHALHGSNIVLQYVGTQVAFKKA